MLANQKMIGSNGKQNALFPFNVMYITQGEEGGSSHVGMYAMDFVGYTPIQGQIYKYPYYAPFDCICVAKFAQMVVWQSLTDVNAIDGYTGKITIGFGHDDNNPNIQIGTIKNQGDLIGHTGTYGNVGDHCHMEIVEGVYAGFEQVHSTGYYRMKNSTHLYNVLGVNDTTIYRGLSYPWQEFSDTPIHITKIKHKFPWVLYARKLRER